MIDDCLILDKILVFVDSAYTPVIDAAKVLCKVISKEKFLNSISFDQKQYLNGYKNPYFKILNFILYLLIYINKLKYAFKYI